MPTRKRRPNSSSACSRKAGRVRIPAGEAMDTHVKVLGALQIALGAFGLMGAVFLFIVFTGTAGLVSASGDPDAQVALPFIGITGMALVTFLTTLSLPSLI